MSNRPVCPTSAKETIVKLAGRGLPLSIEVVDRQQEELLMSWSWHQEKQLT